MDCIPVNYLYSMGRESEETMDYTQVDCVGVPKIKFAERDSKHARLGGWSSGVLWRNGEGWVAL